MSDANKALFLSYAREDAAPAKRIAEALRGFGVEVWFDMSELRGGDQWDAKIRGQIKACALFVPIISQTTQDRDEAYFRLEWKLADDRSHLMAPGKPFIVPVVIDATPEVGASVPDSFMKAQWTRLPGGEPSTVFIAQIQRLLEAKASTGRTTPPLVPVAPPPVPAKKSSTRWTQGTATAVVVGIVVALSVSQKSESPSSATASPAALSPAVAPSPAASPAPAKAPDKSIAVLPFDNRSDNKNDAYFTDGIHDDLLTQISHIRDIKTISRTSVLAYKGTAKNMRTIGEELGVATILEGGVQRAGNLVRINMQLIDAKTDTHLWAETYTREMTAENIFAIQSEITSSIAKALQAVLLPSEQKQIEHRATNNLAALEKYFAANALVAEGNTEKMRRAVELYQEAIRLDDGFAPAYARLAETYLTQIYWSGLPVEIQIPKAKAMIDRALELDPSLSEGQVALGGLLGYQNNFAGAKAAYERALELKPNNDAAYLALANLLSEHDESSKGKAFGLLRKALELSPEDPGINRTYALALANLDRLDEAHALAKKLVIRFPGDALTLAVDGIFDGFQGDWISGFIKLRKAYAMDPGNAIIADQLYERSKYVLADDEWSNFWLERSVTGKREGKLPLAYRLYFLIYQKKLAEADALWRSEYKTLEDVKASVCLWTLMLGDIKAGRGQAPKARYELVNPELFAEDPQITDSEDGLFRAKDVGLSLVAAGDKRQASRLLEKAARLAQAHNQRTFRFILAKVRIAQGDRAGFFETLRELVKEKTNLEYYYNDPEFAVYQKDPEYQALFGDVARRHNELVATLRRMDANGELAPVPPLPEGKL